MSTPKGYIAYFGISSRSSPMATVNKHSAGDSGGLQSPIPAEACCGVHPEVAAVELCKRCGRFLCRDCVSLVGEDAYCADCRVQHPGAPSRLATAALAVASGATALLAVILIFVALNFGVGGPELEAHVDLVGNCTLASLAVVAGGALATLLAFIELVLRTGHLGLPGSGGLWRSIVALVLGVPVTVGAVVLLFFLADQPPS